MTKPELVLLTLPSGEPLVRGYCSACPNVTFSFVNTPDSQRKIKQAFERHFQQVHASKDADSQIPQA
jgi:hypothetical protein